MKRPLRRELMFQLVETSRLMRTYVDQRAREHGTTRAQWGVLSRLRRQEGLNQAALAEQMDLQPISLARLLDRLQSQDLIERRENPADRRAYLLYLTTAGRRLVDDLDDGGEGVYAEDVPAPPASLSRQAAARDQDVGDADRMTARPEPTRPQEP